MFSATSPPQIDYNRYLLDYINHQYQLFLLLLYCCEYNLYSFCSSFERKKIREQSVCVETDKNGYCREKVTPIDSEVN